MSFTSDKNAAVNKIQNSAESLNADLHNAATQAGQKVRSMIASANDEISQASDKVTAEIRTHPIQSTVIALGVGVLLGALLRR